MTGATGSLPYQWWPDGTRWTHRVPKPGTLIAYEHAVYEALPAVPAPGETAALMVRARQVSGRSAEVGQVVDLPGGGNGRPHYGTGWDVYPTAHWVACGRCLEPVPCREVMQAAYARAQTARMNRYTEPGVCPACQEPVNANQRSVTFPDNLEVPGGPPVTFHTGRQECRRFGALNYQDRWLAADAARVPLIGEHDPYPGVPNRTQRELLALAARGDLRCHSTLIHVALPDTDLGAIMRGEDDPTAFLVWYPSGLTSAQSRFLPPLLEAGLIEPPPLPTDRRTRPDGTYRLTDEGWKHHRAYPAREAS